MDHEAKKVRLSLRAKEVRLVDASLGQARLKLIL